jgi:hypothetical protein
MKKPRKIGMFLALALDPFLNALKKGDSLLLQAKKKDMALSAIEEGFFFYFLVTFLVVIDALASLL